jgi:signal transduction histidine kinase
LHAINRVYAQHINTAATHLLAILNDILDLSKLEAGGLSIMPATFDLDELLATVGFLFLMQQIVKACI